LLIAESPAVIHNSCSLAERPVERAPYPRFSFRTNHGATKCKEMDSARTPKLRVLSKRAPLHVCRPSDISESSDRLCTLFQKDILSHCGSPSSVESCSFESVYDVIIPRLKTFRRYTGGIFANPRSLDVQTLTIVLSTWHLKIL